MAVCHRYNILIQAEPCLIRKLVMVLLILLWARTIWICVVNVFSKVWLSGRTWVKKPLKEDTRKKTKLELEAKAGALAEEQEWEKDTVALFPELLQGAHTGLQEGPSRPSSVGKEVDGDVAAGAPRNKSPTGANPEALEEELLLAPASPEEKAPASPVLREEAPTPHSPTACAVVLQDTAPPMPIEAVGKVAGEIQGPGHPSLGKALDSQGQEGPCSSPTQACPSHAEV